MLLIEAGQGVRFAGQFTTMRTNKAMRVCRATMQTTGRSIYAQ